MMFRPMPVLPPIEDVVAEAETISATVVVGDVSQAQLVYGVFDGEPVWRRYVPATLEETGETVFVLWDATGGPEPVQLDFAALEPEYRREANILSRTTNRGAFSNSDDPDANIWYTFDLAGMSRRLSLSPPAERVVEPLLVTVRKADDVSRSRRALNPYAYDAVRDPLPPQRHFGYALTWWGMAIGLIGEYLAFHHSRDRLRFRR